MIGFNEIENVSKELRINASVPSELPTPDNYIIPGLSDPIGISPESQGVYDQVNQYFNQQDEQAKTVSEARGILAESAKDLTDEQVYDLVNEVQYLVDSWLEEYEKDIFNGKTLIELISL